jgi:4-amino-4-deoxy-L-arabinose transferase-like glycosyltransferase/membrane-associated phospholipid phosphatase
MSWALSIDIGLFRWINQGWANPFFDFLMPIASGNPFFAPALVVVLIFLWLRGGPRGRLCVVMFVLLALVLNNVIVSDWLKKAIQRPRPFVDLPDVRLLVGRGSSYSMPSSHASNWFATAAVVWVYYRRSWVFMVPLACLVSLSRIYNGVHYPSDVAVGAMLGVATGLGGVYGLNACWQIIGPRWFPIWWRQLPCLVRAEYRRDPMLWRPGAAAVRNPEVVEERQWINLGYALIAVLFLGRLAYLRSGIIELSKDEAYQWLWSKHLDLSYYSKPPLIAWLQFVGTHLFGDTELGVRFFAPFLAAVVAMMVLRFMGREVGGRPAFWTLIGLSAAPIAVLGTILFTVDGPLVFSWVAAMISGWRAVQREGRTRDWVWTGFWIGLGFLSKYAGLLQWVPFILWMLLWPRARMHLRKPGFYIGVLVSLAFTIPVIMWNANHDWITLTHLQSRAGVTEPWRPTLRFFTDFVLAEFALLNPVFFCGMVWAGVIAWQRRKSNPLLFYLFLMGAPLFIGFLLYSFRARVYPNWIAPAIVPLFCMLFACAHSRWQANARLLRRSLIIALAIGLPVVAVLHKSELVSKLVGKHLPPEADPLRRVRAWTETSNAVGEARRKLESEGKPVFVVCAHYGIAAQFSFYMPEAKAAARKDPIVFYQSSAVPENQFYFWPGYKGRRSGQNAIYVVELDPYKLGSGWFWQWIRGKPISRATAPPDKVTPPQRLFDEFESIEDLGMREIEWRNRGVYRRIWLFACRNLK